MLCVVSASETIQELELIHRSSPVEANKRLREAKSDNYPQFLREVVGLLKRGEDTKFARLVITVLREDGQSLEDLLFQPQPLTFEEAKQAIRLATRVDSSYPSYLLDRAKAELEAFLQDAGKNTLGPGQELAGSAREPEDGWSVRRLTRVLELLSQTVEPPRLSSMLTRLCSHTDPHLRSKAVLLAGRFLPHDGARREVLQDADPRIRANAVESTWGQRDAKTIEMLLRATNDPHHRVAANAVLGLYWAGEARCFRLLHKMLLQGTETRQLAAVWAMGKAADPRFQGWIEMALPAASGRARSGFLKAARAVKARREKMEGLPPIEVQLIRVLRFPRGRVHCGLHVKQARDAASFVASAQALQAPQNNSDSPSPQAKIPSANLPPPDLPSTGGLPNVPTPHDLKAADLKAIDLKATDLIVYDGDLRVDAVRLEARGSAAPGHVLLLLPSRSGVGDPFARSLVEAVTGALAQKRPSDSWALVKYEPFWESPAEDRARNATPGPVEFLSSAEAIRTGPLQATRGSAPSLSRGVEEALLSFPMGAANCHLVIVRDPDLPTQALNLGPWLERAAQFGVQIHAVVCGRAGAEEMRYWHHLTLERAGFAVACPQAVDLASAVCRLSTACAASFDLTYELGRLGPEQAAANWPLRIEIVSSLGLANLEIDTPPPEPRLELAASVTNAPKQPTEPGAGEILEKAT